MSGVGPISAAPAPGLWVGPFTPQNAVTAVGPATASKALFYGFTVPSAVTVGHASVMVATQSGNVDIGIYDNTGKRLASTGSTACGGAGAVQTIALTAPCTLMPGQVYWAAFCPDTTASSFWTGGSLPGFNVPGYMYRTLTSFPLPLNVTPVTNAPDRLYLIWFSA